MEEYSKVPSGAYLKKSAPESIKHYLTLEAFIEEHVDHIKLMEAVVAMLKAHGATLSNLGIKTNRW